MVFKSLTAIQKEYFLQLSKDENLKSIRINSIMDNINNVWDYTYRITLYFKQQSLFSSLFL